MVFVNQVLLLLWKNWLLQRRKPFMTLFEILLPLSMVALLLSGRSYIGAVDIKEPITYEPETLHTNMSNVYRRGFAVPEEEKTEPQRGSIIGFAPGGDSVKKLMLIVERDTDMAEDANTMFKAFVNEDSMVKYSTNHPGDVIMCITFLNVEEGADAKIPKDVQYAVRPPSSSMYSGWQTEITYPVTQAAGPRSQRDDDPVKQVLYMQTTVADAIIKYWLSKKGEDPNLVNHELRTKRIIYPPFLDDKLMSIMQSLFPDFLIFSVIMSVIINTKQLVYEKEYKLKESMKMMGLVSSALWVSWFTTFCIFLVPILIIFTICLCFPVMDGRAVIPNSNAGIILLFLLAYGLATITFCFMMSSIIQSANLAGAIAGGLFYVFSLPMPIVKAHYGGLARVLKLLICLDFNLAMAMGANVIGLMEGTGEGVNWNNFFKPASVDDNISLLEIITMLFVDSLLHMFIFWYVDHIWPGDFGVAQPYHFCLTKAFWSGEGLKADASSRQSTDVGEDDLRFEAEPENLKAGIQINHLTKKFGLKNAVNGLSLNMYEGQITVLLGHNGAGKTTTMSILTGFMPPTTGTAIVNGCDITKDMQGVRSSLGLCPQHNILFDKLTTKEHLQLFGSLKGCSSGKTEAEIIPLLNEMGLREKMNEFALGLSGGQKRKLSVAIALIGGSKVVILDEPSAGMDPGARRQTWDVLQKQREGRTVLLTTHYMDEADVLGDRIAIMAEGVVKCCGTSMFLKKLYGAGYHLVVVKRPSCVVRKITHVVKSHVVAAKLESVVNQEVSYLLPERETARFAALFTELDEKKDRLGIDSFGTSATTMEEVFLKVGESAFHHDDDQPIEHQSDDGENGAKVDAPSTKTRGDIGRKVSVNSERRMTPVDPDVGQMTPITPNEGTSGLFTAVTPIEATSGAETPTAAQILDPPQQQQRRVRLDTSKLMSRLSVHSHVSHSDEDVADALERGDAVKFSRGYERNKGLALEMGKMRGIFVKKMINTRRKPFMGFIQITIPIVFAFIALSAQQQMSPTTEKKHAPALTLDLSHFESPTIIPTTSGGPNSMPDDGRVEKTYAAQFGKDHDAQSFKAAEHDGYDNYTAKLAEELGIGPFNKRVIIGLEVTRSGRGNESTLGAISYYNGQPLHAKPIGINYLMNALLQFYLDKTYSLQTVLHPLPEDVDDHMRTHRIGSFSFAMSFALVVFVGMSFMVSMFVTYYIKERQVGAKHLQVVSGVSPITYWLPSFAWDYIIYLVPCICLFLMFIFSGVKVFGDGTRAAAVLIHLLMYGWSVLPFMYLLQFLFSSPATGMNIISTVTIIAGIIMLLIISILKMFGGNRGKMEFAFMFLLPNFNMAQGFVEIYINYMNYEECKDVDCNEDDMMYRNPCCAGCEQMCLVHGSYLALDAPGIGGNIVMFFCTGIIYFTLVFLVEIQVLQLIWYKIMSLVRKPDPPDKREQNREDEDSDVADERKRINASPPGTLFKKDSLLLVNLYKKYGRNVAVDHTCLGVPKQECFGLLGQNGAGKTTTFKMLTGDVMVTGGNAYLAGNDICNNIKKVQANLGYCPQFDALIDIMTGRETLTMYARLRGVPEKNIQNVVNSLVDTLMLTQDADKPCGVYSGGNKRKLSTAIALVGTPDFIMLDEPSAGMDPKARRHLWTVLSQVRASGRTLILTSHSMEECDALCTRLAIMVNGRFVCLGSPQHLKNKFGVGFILVVQMGTDEKGLRPPLEPLIEYVQEYLPGLKVFDEFQGYIHFQVTDPSVKLGTVFGVMEATREYFNIKDYSVHQTTLEQIFLTFTRAQQAPPEEGPKG